MMTRAPFCTRPCAAISPSPEAPPVTRATWLLKEKRLETRRSALEGIVGVWVGILFGDAKILLIFKRAQKI
ncbi:hypothetical protein I7I50_04347 [Histoplasma capsulatum G186AR]|uniref:Uncharacterized protein n=1 Tax=Ajellomyces capsulatus TaxID=5037 RepID=A0A8H7YK21_AJECA|nr:hypothetical protein I7I52_05255 [Histoplasma capsulatum]QSS75266.1 hypothetical protein I7I50_04347 [Histoplasma capsulatum G186AR]